MKTVNKSDIEKILEKLWEENDSQPQPSENRSVFNEALQKVQAGLDTLEEKEVTEVRTVKYHGYIVRSDGYNGLEFYEKPPKRVWGTYDNHWTYTDPREFSDVLPLKIMPDLKWEDEPVEVVLETKVLVVNK